MTTTTIPPETLLKIYEAARPDLVRAWIPRTGCVPSGRGCVMNWLGYHAREVAKKEYGCGGHLAFMSSHAQTLRDTFVIIREVNGIGTLNLGIWNDTHSHAEVLAAVDVTITFLKNQIVAGDDHLPDSLRCCLKAETPKKEAALL